MKKIMFSLYIIGCIFVFSCQQEPAKNIQNCCLSSEDSLTITKEIIETTDAYAEANSKLDIDKCAEFWDSSPDLMFAETGREYTSWDSVYNDIKKWYSQPLDSVQFTWEDRNITPLNHHAATLYSKASFRAKFESGMVYKSKVNIGVLLMKKNDKWKTTIGYWSIELLEHE